MHGLTTHTPARRIDRHARIGEVAHRRSRLRLRGAREGGAVSLNVVPLVDVTFLLMIFFVISGSFDVSEGVLRSGIVPAAGRSGTTALPLTPIVIKITSSVEVPGACSLELAPFGHRPSSFNELRRILSGIRRQPGFDEQAPVAIRADDGVLWEHVVNGWNAALGAGFSNLAYADSAD